MTKSSIRYWAVRRLAFTPLGPYVQPYLTQLVAQGYPTATIRAQLRHMVKLGRWLSRTGRDLRALNEDVLDRFWRRRLPGRKKMSAAPALDLFLAILRKARVIPPPMAVSQTPVQRLAVRYGRYLIEERGLSHSAVEHYCLYTERFLTHHFGAGSAALSRIRARDVIEYVQQNARTHSSRQTRNVVIALRSFLRFLHFQGLIRTDLAAVVPAVANWRMTGLPKHLPAEAVRQVLDGCDQTTPLGQRDYAILLLLARLGLRAGEVAALELEDIEWENAQLTIRSKKGRGWARMPLPKEVGKAIARYLRYGRPTCSCRNVFVRSVAPYNRRLKSWNISGITRSGLRRAGVKSARQGAHLFRHSLATAMLHHGASLDEIGQVLRHQHPNTTAIYAKVDLTALRQLAVPWPGGVR